MQTGHDYFLHGLSDILDAERQLVNALEELAGDSSQPELKKTFEQHRKETVKQVERVEKCFKAMDAEPEDTECDGIRGIVEEKSSFQDEDPSEDIVNVFNIVAGIKSEAYEICEYESLIALAREMKHKEVVRLLTENLNEEKATLKKLQTLSRKIKPKVMMNEEEQESSSRAEPRSQTHRKRAA